MRLCTPLFHVFLQTTRDVEDDTDLSRRVGTVLEKVRSYQGRPLTIKIVVEGRSREGEGQKMVFGEGRESSIDDGRVTVDHDDRSRESRAGSSEEG
jgi:hypothetical protein